jgi:hypothetical protein
VTPVYKLSANSVKNGRTVYGSMLAGNTAFIATAFESIATVTVGSGGAANVEFTSIPATYTHLQVRGIGRSTRTATIDDLGIRINSDTGSNYAYHILRGDGASVIAAAGATQTTGYAGRIAAASATSSVFGVAVIDILDYANTNKYKTIRGLAGSDNNGNGNVEFGSTLWMNTNAITNILLYPPSFNFAQYTHFALYGIKGA